MLKKILDRIILIAFFLIVIVCMILYSSNESNKKKAIEEHIKVERLISINDSILNLPPDTIKSDPIYLPGKDSVVYITKWREPSLSDSTYYDSIKNDSIDLDVTIKAVDLSSITYNYRPIYKYQTITVEKSVPKYIDVIKEVKNPQSGLFFKAGIGGSKKDVAISAELMLLTTRQRTFSAEYVKFGSENIYMGKFGIRF